MILIVVLRTTTIFCTLLSFIIKHFWLANSHFHMNCMEGIIFFKIEYDIKPALVLRRTIQYLKGKIKVDHNFQNFYVSYNKHHNSQNESIRIHDKNIKSCADSLE